MAFKNIAANVQELANMLFLICNQWIVVTHQCKKRMEHKNVDIRSSLSACGTMIKREYVCTLLLMILSYQQAALFLLCLKLKKTEELHPADLLKC